MQFGLTELKITLVVGDRSKPEVPLKVPAGLAVSELETKYDALRLELFDVPDAAVFTLEDGKKYFVVLKEKSGDIKSMGKLLEVLIEEQQEKKKRRALKEQETKQHTTMLETISSHVNKKNKKSLDCWDKDSLLSVERDAHWKNELLDFYDRRAKHGKIYCQVLNRKYYSDDVIASHIWKFATKGQGLEQFGIPPANINHVRNGLLLCKGLEEAFDRKQVCFLYNFLHDTLNLFVADDGLRDKLIKPSKTIKFKHVDGDLLLCPKGNLPYRRLLSWHAHLTLEKYGRTRLKNSGRIYKPYRQLSEGVPDLSSLFERVRTGAGVSENEGDSDTDEKSSQESSEEDGALLEEGEAESVVQAKEAAVK